MPALPASAPITLATRRTVLLALVLVAASVTAVWISETALRMVSASDRYAYPLLVAWFLALALLLWRRPRQLLQVQRLASLALLAYFVGSVTQLLLGSSSPPFYDLATMGYWLAGAHLMLFLTWAPRRALLLAVA
ncbi:MAG: hypothetical protein WAQ05_01160, partial [Rubrivivax sp.]